MKQTWENGKKINIGPDFGLFGPNLGPNFFWAPKFFFVGLTSTRC